MTDSGWIVHKFGGTSVKSAERYRDVARILGDWDAERQAVVVSAMGGMTDMLLDLVGAAERREQDHGATWGDALEAVGDRLFSTLDDLLGAHASAPLRERFSADLEDIADVLRATELLGTATRQALDLISGYGELWSAQTLHAHLSAKGAKATWLDARDVLRVEPVAEGTPRLLMEHSQELLDTWMKHHAGSDIEVVVITGFIASTLSGLSTTLGRNGSDYSAAIFSALLGAPTLTIWTDVDGVMSANPKIVPEAIVLDELSYQEAMELAYFGAKVLHPSTIAPAVQRDVDIWIKNTFRPDVPGTKIWARGSSSFAVKGFTTISGMALVNLEGTNMIGVPGIAQRLFGALREASVSVVMISQASSEHSICFVVPNHHADRAREVVERAFFAERHQNQIQTLEVTRDVAILAVVGDHMAGRVGVAATFFHALGNARVNIRAIAQGSSERNISVVLDDQDATRALRAVHSAFTLSKTTLSIGVIGAGSVGSTLLKQLAAQHAKLASEFNVDLRVRAISTSSGMVLHETRLPLDGWRDAMDEYGRPLDIEALVNHVDADHLPHTAIVDCTASEDVASMYLEWLARGIHVVTPNKKANTGPHGVYAALREGRLRGAHYFYETTVGAGLPIIQTLRELIQTGDEVESIEGILSGTLSYLFNSFDGSAPFSELVKQARELGYTEPDPREDLSGTDVARKLVILAREMGRPLELAEVQVTSLVPESMTDLSVDDFLGQLGEIDDEMERMRREAHAAGDVLRFVGQVQMTGEVTVGLRRISRDHPFARIQTTDNIVQFTTRRYSTNPLVVQGPGAGPEVTAGGVFADILRLVSTLGA